MSSALASATCYSILALEGLTELLPELRDDVSMEAGASFDTLALSLLDGHNDPVRLDRTAKRLWRRVLGDGPAANPDDEPSQPGWASLRIKLDRCIHRAKGSLAQSLANQGLRASDDAVPTSTSGSVRTLTPTEESDMDARWLAAGRRQPGEMFAPSAQFLALMAKYLWPVGRADTTEGLVLRPTSFEWPAREQIPIEHVATRKGVHFRKAGSAGVAPASAYAVVERFECKLLAAEMTLCGREAPASYTCEVAGSRVALSERAVAQTSELVRTLLSTAATHADALPIMLSAVHRLDEDVRDYVRQKMSPGAALMAAWPTLRAQIVQVDREGQRAVLASPAASVPASALEQLLTTMAASAAAAADKPSAGSPAALLASLLSSVPAVTKQRSGKARASDSASPLSGAVRSQLNNFFQQVAKGAKPAKAAPAAPKSDPTLSALLALIKGKGAASSGGDEVCKNFASTGKCKFGAKCRYSH